MSDTIKESIETMLSAIASGDTDNAKDMFNNLIVQKAAARLEDMKVDVANQYFNGVQTEAAVEEVEDEAE